MRGRTQTSKDTPEEAQQSKINGQGNERGRTRVAALECSCGVRLGLSSGGVVERGWLLVGADGEARNLAASAHLVLFFSFSKSSTQANSLSSRGVFLGRPC